MLYSFKASASCFHPVGVEVEVLFRNKSFTKSTMWVFAITEFFKIISPLSLHRISGMDLMCVKDVTHEISISLVQYLATWILYFSNPLQRLLVRHHSK